MTAQGHLLTPGGKGVSFTTQALPMKQSLMGSKSFVLFTYLPFSVTHDKTGALIRVNLYDGHIEDNVIFCHVRDRNHSLTCNQNMHELRK